MERTYERRNSVDSCQSADSASSSVSLASAAEVLLRRSRTAEQLKNRSRAVQVAARQVEKWYTQAFLAAISALHWIGYFLHHIVEEAEDTDRFIVTWILTTGVALSIFSLAELLTRVWTQAGPLCKSSTWCTWLVPRMYKFESFALVVMLIGIGKSLHVTFVLAEEGSDFDNLSAQMVIVSVPSYRIIRWMTDAQEVSVYKTIAKRREFASAEGKLWAKDARKEKERYQRKIKVRLGDTLDHYWIQICAILILAFHTFCYSIAGSNSSLNDWVAFSIPTGYIITGLFAFEFVIRFWAQGGELFFMPCLNRAEFGCLAIGISLLFYSTWYREMPEQDFVPPGYISSFLLLQQRLLRIIGIIYDINGDFSHSNTVAGVKAVQFFMSKFGDVLEIPEQNVHISAHEAWIHKAKLRPEAFEGLHVPLRVTDGLVEELYIRTPDLLRGHSVFVLHVKNLLLLLGPGDGLAEAGQLTQRAASKKSTAEQATGMQSPERGDRETEEYWSYKNVVDAKARLIDILCKHIQPRPQESVEAQQPSSGTKPAAEAGAGYARLFLGSASRFKDQMKYHVVVLFGKIKKRLASMAKSTVQRVEVSICNVTIQYEDAAGCLGGPKNATVGARLGKAWLRFKQDAFVQCNICRAGIYVEPMLPSRDKTQVGTLFCPSGHSWKEPIGNLLRQDPGLALRELERFDTTERFRLWAFEGKDNPLPNSQHVKQGFQQLSDAMRHRRMERWPEHRLIFLLVHITLQAGTEIGHAQMHEEEELHKMETYGESPTDCKQRRERLRKASFQSSQNVQPFRVSAQQSLKDLGSPKTPKDEQTTLPWNWHIHTGRCVAPVTFMVDYDQVQCLHRILSCTKAWGLLDNAFRWRPNLWLRDCGAEADALERNSLARLWWIYAIHRVLAQQNMRPKIPWLDTCWQVTNCSRYRALLAEANVFPTKDKRNRRGVDQPNAHLLQWMKELQVRLPILVIVDCHKKKQQRLVGTVETEKPRAAPSQGQLTRVVTKLADLPKRLTPKGAKVGTLSRPEDLVRQISGHTLFVFDVDDDEDSELNGERRSITSESLAPMHIQSSAGLWDISLPAVDVRILCPGRAPRPVLLHAKWRGVAIHAIKSDPEDEHHPSSPGETPCGHSSSMVSATVTVDDFHVVCPEAGNLLLGGSRHICTVLQQVILPAAPRGSEFLATQKEGKPLAFAFRGTARPGKSGLAEMHVPHMRVVFYEPLLLALQRFAKKSDGEGSFDIASLIQFAGRPSRRKTISKTLQGDGGGGFSLRNGRLGPFLKTWFQVVHTDSHQSIDDLQRWSGNQGQADHIQQVRQMRRLVKKAHAFRHKFEMMSGFAGAIKEWRMDYHSGAIHLFQVGEYSDNALLVEEYQIQNFKNAGSGAAGPFTGNSCVNPTQLPSDRLVMFEFNGYSDDMLLPWDDSLWHVDEGLGHCQDFILEAPPIRAGGGKKRARKSSEKRPTGEVAQVNDANMTATPGKKLKSVEAQRPSQTDALNQLVFPKSGAGGTASTWQSWCEGFSCALPGALPVSSTWPSCCTGLPEVSNEESLTIDESNISLIVHNSGEGHKRKANGYRAENCTLYSTPSCTGFYRQVSRNEFANGWLDAESARWRAWLLRNT